MLLNILKTLIFKIMELNILLEGEGGSLVADSLAARLSGVRILRVDTTMLNDAESIGALITAKHVAPDVLVFEGIATPEILMQCVAALKTYRVSGTNAAKIPFDRLTRGDRDGGKHFSPDVYDVSAIFICDANAIVLTSTAVRYAPAFKGDLSPYATRGKLKDTIENITPEDAAAMAERWKDSFFKPDGAAYSPQAGELGHTLATKKSYSLTWDKDKQSFEAADFTADGKVLCSAVNVYKFASPSREMLFELAEVVPVSGLHIAVDKMNTHYFRTGRFEYRAFNAQYVRPATPTEVLEYLNAKHQYNAKTN